MTRKVGRPSKLTKETIDVLVKCIKTGMYYEQSCDLADISYDTFKRWMRLGEENKSEEYQTFYTTIKQAKAYVLQRNLEIIDKAAADGKWQAAAWKLERRYPTQYGRQEKRLLEHSGEIKADTEDVDTRIKKWRQLVEELNADANRSEETAGDSG
jgi:transposase